MATSSEIPEPPQRPIGAGERLVTLDFIRGVAVLGILFANITAFAQPATAYFWPPALAGGATAGDEWVWVVQFVVVDGKFRGLFTLLFGAGLALFMDRAVGRGGTALLQARRLGWLLLFGLVHLFLIWRGDILTLYAVWGLAALPAVRLPETTQLSIGLTMYLFGSLLMCGLLGASYLEAIEARGPDPSERAAALLQTPATLLARANAELALYRDGSWLAIAADSFAHRPGELVRELVLVGITETVGLLFIGMALYRYRFFSGAIEPAVLRRWGWAGVLAGGAASLLAALWVYHEGFGYFHTLFVFNGLGALLHLPMVLGLAALLAAWAPTAVRRPLGARLAAAGRMAFSNYLGTSLAMVALFQGWGLGWFGRFHRLELLAFVALGWVAMLAWSPWWLARFRYGPLEWLWRCLTYGRWVPLRRIGRD